MTGNLALETVLIIGDTPFDAEAATKAKLKIIGILYGGFAERDLRSGGCLEIYKNPADLLKNYEEIKK